MAGSLSLHVLDTAQGKPAIGMKWELWRVDRDGGNRVLLVHGRTNRDGRADGNVLEGAAFVVGAYELVFDVADYFRAQNVPLAHPPFIDRVPIRFSIADATSHYHVPLGTSPWAYNTYRGS